MDGALLIDIGSTYTKVTAVDLDGETLLGTARAFTTVRTDVNEGLEQAIRDLETRTGKIGYTRKLACSSAAGGLKMIAVGLVPELTAQAARMAALSAGAKVLRTYSYELSATEAEEIQYIRPDIVLLSGGTDGGNSSVLLHNSKVLAGVAADFPVVLAGNKSVADSAAALLRQSGKEVRICGNVMPEFNVLDIEPARQVIQEIFLQRIILAKGLSRVGELVENILMPTPSAVLNAAKLLASGYEDEKGLGDLLMVDAGGATTDVYSIAEGLPDNPGVILKGLPEPFEKRTVEGDLGVRYNAATLAETAGVAHIARLAGLSVPEVEQGLEAIAREPGIVPATGDKLAQLDFGLGAMAVKLAVERHAGRLETAYTPLGVAYIQTGKDLGRVDKIIGTGGPVINSLEPRKILEQALLDPVQPQILKPRKAEFLLDRQYILASMGLLGTIAPKLAVQMMKRELEIL